jgi:hypothetical protein
MRALLSRGWSVLRNSLANQAELQERLALLNCPWEEDFLHWVGEGASRELHGRIPPPPDGRRRSVTRTGWCPGLAGGLHTRRAGSSLEGS